MSDIGLGTELPPVLTAPSAVTPTTPIAPSNPDNIRALARKYRSPDPGLAREFARATPGARTALRTLDTRKVASGTTPYAAKESAYGLRAASDNTPTTAPRDPSLFESLSEDARALLTSIPKLPALLAQEPVDMWKAYTGQSTGVTLNSPFDLAKAPGLRMLPGAFVLGQFGSGPESQGFSGLAAHPLFTGLDILPYASKAARATSTVRKATELAGPQAAILDTAPRVKPLSSLARNWHPGGPKLEPFIDPRTHFPVAGVGQLAPNRFGRGIDRVMNRVAETRAGAVGREAWGEASRSGAQAGNQVMYQEMIDQIQQAERALDNGLPLDNIKPAAVAFVKANKISAESALTPSASSDLFRSLLSSRDRAATLASLPDNVRTYATDLLDSQDALLADMIDRGLMSPVEYTDPTTGQKFTEHLRTQDAVRIVGFDGLPNDAAREIAAAASGNRFKLGRRGEAAVAQDFATRATLARNPTLAAGKVDDILNELPAILDGTLPGFESRTTRLAGARASLSILDQLGYDVRPIWKQITAADTRRKLARVGEDVALSRYVDNGGVLPAGVNYTHHSFNPRASAAALDDALTQLKSSADKKAVQFSTQIASGDWSGALKSLTALKKRTAHSWNIDWSAVRDDLTTRINTNKATAKLDELNWTDKEATKAAQRLQRAESYYAPARFAEPIRATAKDRFLADLRAAVNGDADAAKRLKLPANHKLTAAESDAAAQIMADGVADRLVKLTGDVDLRDSYQAYFADARRTWLDLRAQGVDPFYIHTVTPRQARAMINASVMDHVSSISSAKDKAKSIETQIDASNLALSVTHQAHELLLRDATTAYLKLIQDRFAVPMNEARDMFSDRAARIAQSTGRDYAEVLTDLTSRHFTPFIADAKSFAAKKNGSVSLAFGDAKFVIPRELASSLDKLIAQPGPLAQFFGTPMHLFRTALLPLSPRWHLNNVVSGAIITGIKTGPGALKHMRQAWDMARHHDGIAKIPGAPASGTMASSMAWGRESMAGIIHAPVSTRLAAIQSYFGGRAAGKAINSVANSLGDRGITWIQSATDATSGVIQKSYNFNQLFDDFYRSVAYLYGESKALKAGNLTADEARRAGVALSRDVLQNWDRMTPIERGVIRNVFPFYSWAAHVIRFAARYPADHPFRLAIAARLADHEYNDHLEGVPQRLRDLLFLSDVNGEGEITGISVSGFNPFRDLVNYPAVAGFLTGQEGGNLSAVTGQINPIVGAVMESVGLDPAFGADLYPDLEYDPSTGGLRIATPSFPETFATNIIPQLKSVTALLGWNKDFRRLAQTNPDAATRHLQGALGIPVLAKTVNMDEEQIKAEITRYRQQMDERAAALKAGDIGKLERWPALRAQADKIRGWTPEQRARLTPRSHEPSLWDLAPALIPTKRAG